MFRRAGKVLSPVVSTAVDMLRNLYRRSRRFVLSLFEDRSVRVTRETRTVAAEEIRSVRSTVDGADLMLQWPSKDPAETLDYDVIWIDRIDPNDYIWPSEWGAETGIGNQFKGRKTVLAALKIQPTHLVNDGKVDMPNNVSPEMGPRRRAQLDRLRPAWA